MLSNIFHVFEYKYFDNGKFMSSKLQSNPYEIDVYQVQVQILIFLLDI